MEPFKCDEHIVWDCVCNRWRACMHRDRCDPEQIDEETDWQTCHPVEILTAIGVSKNES